MSDGGKDTTKQQPQQQQQQQQQQLTTNPKSSDEFVRAVAKTSVAQICENEGFQGFQNSAIESLADVALRYVMQIGKNSILYANQDGRTECNVFDVILGLENLGSIQGFPGASNARNPSIAKSSVVRGIRQYVSFVEEVPFAFSLPRFPVSKSRVPPSSFLQMGTVSPCHVPPWLPAFPLLDVEKKDDMVNVQLQEPQPQPQQQEHLTGSNGVDSVEVNPFLAPPFAFGEKQVSVIEPPSRIWEGNHVHYMDTFAPMEETARNENEGTEVVDASKDEKLDDRPRVRLKFSKTTRRKSLSMFRNVIGEVNVEDEVGPVLFERNDENEEKKRRAELILKESMETPLDTNN